MNIDYLADHPEVIPTLARWLHDHWIAFQPNPSIDERIARLSRHLQKAAIPETVIAWSAGQFVGAASLVVHDMETRRDLSPWLAQVYVHPDFRKQGIASALIQRLIEDARDLGVKHLYLYTTDQEDFYRRRGWELLSHTQYRGGDVAVMVRAIQGNSLSGLPVLGEKTMNDSSARSAPAHEGTKDDDMNATSHDCGKITGGNEGDTAGGYMSSSDREQQARQHLIDLIINQDHVAQNWLKFLLTLEAGLAVALFSVISLGNADRPANPESAQFIAAACSLLPALGMLGAAILTLIVVYERKWQRWFIGRYIHLLEDVEGQPSLTIYPTDNSSRKVIWRDTPMCWISKAITAFGTVILIGWIIVLGLIWTPFPRLPRSPDTSIPPQIATPVPEPSMDPQLPKQ